MSEPIVFISHSRVRDGQLEGLRDFLAAGAPALEADKPLTLAFLPYPAMTGPRSRSSTSSRTRTRSTSTSRA